MTAGEPHSSLPALSRSLLTPGPLAPMSHFGLTLLRHVVGTGLRYSLYQLGLPIPEAAPVRLTGLRLFLDAKPLTDLLGGADGGPAVLRCLLSPSSRAVESLPQRVSIAAALHRRRLRWWPRRTARIEAPGPQASRRELWRAFENGLSRRLPQLNDAVLRELVAVLERQGLRARDRNVEAALGREAWRAHRGQGARLEKLGAVDPLVASWAEEPEPLECCLAEADFGALPSRPSQRGTFREHYRGFLSELRPLLSRLGRQGVEGKILSVDTDLYFIPFQLCEELVEEHRPGWLEGAVGTNRNEHQGFLAGPEHADEIDGSPALAEQRDRRSEWDAATVRPVE